MKRRALTLVTIMVLCVGMVVGLTLAYLKDSDLKENRFSTRDSSWTVDDSVLPVEVKLAEPSWNFAATYQFPARVGNQWLPDPKDEISDAPAGGWGSKSAASFKPGNMILKDPTVRSIGYEPTYVGMIVSVNNVGGTGFQTLADVESKFDIHWNVGTGDGQWTLVGQTAEKKFFVYNGEGGKDYIETDFNKTVSPWAVVSYGETEPLFDYVTVKHSLTGDDIKKDDKFDLVINAYGVQAINDSWDQDTANYAPGRNWGAKTAFKVEFGTEWAPVDYN